MKKLVLALTAIAAFSGSALAADLPARTYSKAPAYEPLPSWTGFYIFGGGGGGVWDANTGVVATGTGTCILCTNQKQGGDGWFGTVGAGYDWQFSGDWVAGVFGRRPVGQHQGFDPGSGSRRYGLGKEQGQLCGRCSAGLPRRSDRLFLRQRRIQRIAMVGHDLAEHRERPRLGLPHQFLQLKWLVHRRWRGEQAGALRLPGSQLVHEDRISCGLQQHQDPQRTLRSSRVCRLAATSPSSRLRRPSARRWSIASTGLAPRWCRSTKSSAEGLAFQKPRHGPGLFCVQSYRC